MDVYHLQTSGWLQVEEVNLQLQFAQIMHFYCQYDAIVRGLANLHLKGR